MTKLQPFDTNQASQLFEPSDGWSAVELQVPFSTQLVTLWSSCGPPLDLV